MKKIDMPIYTNNTYVPTIIETINKIIEKLDELNQDVDELRDDIYRINIK